MPKAASLDAMAGSLAAFSIAGTQYRCNLRAESGRRKESPPDTPEILPVPQLRQRRDIRKLRKFIGYHDSPKAPALQMARQGTKGRSDGFGMSPQNRRHGRGRSFKWNHG